jgi:hypothetical protein
VWPTHGLKGCRLVVCGEAHRDAEPVVQCGASPPVGPPLSYRPARMPSSGRPIPPGRSRETKSCGRRNASVEPSGDVGAATTVGVAQKPRCTASSCWGSGYRQRLPPSGRRGTDPGRGPERLHRTRHARHRGRGIILSAERGGPPVTRFVQQSHGQTVSANSMD